MKSLIILILVISYFSSKTLSQERETPNPYFKIKFVTTISSKSDLFKPDIIDAVSDFVFGQGEQNLIKPVNITAIDSNIYWILDQQLKTIITVDIKNKIFERINFSEELNSLVGLCRINNSSLLFTDSQKNAIYFYEIEAEKMKIINNSPRINRPTGIAYSEIKKEVWCVQTGNHTILILDENGNIKKSLGLRGTGDGEFNFPTHIWIDSNGYVYIVDSMNYRVQVFDLDGKFIKMFGEQGDATGYLASPKGIAVDSFGNIYIVDALFHSVQIFDINGNYLNSFGSQGKRENKFWLPQGIFIDKNNKIYVSDSYNSRVQIYQLVFE